MKKRNFYYDQNGELVFHKKEIVQVLKDAEKIITKQINNSAVGGKKYAAYNGILRLLLKGYREGVENILEEIEKKYRANK